MANILIVAIHGLVCLVDGGFTKDNIDRGFKAYVLRDTDKVHKQMYGDFLAEQDFAAAPGRDFPVNLEFSDELQSGPKTTVLKTDLNPVVKIPDFPPATPANAVAVFTLKRPKQIDYRVRGIINPGMLVDQHNRVSGSPSNISAIRFLQYEFDEQTNVKLYDADNPTAPVWECPQLAAAGSDNIAVFHIYNEPALTINPKSNANGHNVQEFRDSTGFMNADVQITAAAAIDPGSLDSPHDGILSEEIVPLDVRHKDLIQFVNDQRLGTAKLLGGAGGTQVCGGADGIVV